MQSIRSREFSLDRPTAIGIGLLVVAILTLALLIGVITLYPAQTISQSIAEQSQQQEQQLTASLASQIQLYFTSVGNDLLSLADHPEFQSAGATNEIKALIADLGNRDKGQIASIALLGTDGSPLYTWPEQPIFWTTSTDWISNVTKQGGLQLQRPPSGDGFTYLLVKPLTLSGNTSEFLAVQLDLNDYFASTFNKLNLSGSSQLWVFDTAGSSPKLIYSLKKDPTFIGDASKLTAASGNTFISGYPTSDREAVITPLLTGYAQNQNGISFVLVFSRSIGEAQQSVVGILQRLFIVGLGIIALLVLSGIVVGRFLLGENNRRRQAEQRRSTARTLLEMARALNSSLDVNVVLQIILRELGNILMFDSASILLLNEDKRTVTVSAETGAESFVAAAQDSIIPLKDIRGAREVLRSGRPVVINDCANDARWNPTETTQNVQAWLGVPMRVRDEAVGLLNINSYEPERFLTDDVDFAEAFADQAAVAIQNARSHELEIKVYETELETARAIQTSLLPQEQPPFPQFEIAARNIPAQHVSGDYYQYFVLPDGKLGVAIGDVSGKGIAAALLMAVVTTAMRDEIFRTPTPAELLNELNSRLLTRMKQNNMNSALLVSVFDPTTRQVEIANGGMVQPYVRNGKGWDAVPVGGYPLGASARMSYNAKTLTLGPSSILLMISDGVIESQNLKQEFFGFDAFEALLADLPPGLSAEDMVERVLAAVRQHLEGQEPQDDITVVVIKSLE